VNGHSKKVREKRRKSLSGQIIKKERRQGFAVWKTNQARDTWAPKEGKAKVPKTAGQREKGGKLRCQNKKRRKGGFYRAKEQNTQKGKGSPGK